MRVYHVLSKKSSTHPQNRTYKSNSTGQAVTHCRCATISCHLILRCASAFLSTWSSLRPISSSQLHTLLHFHPCPINLVVFKGTYLSRRGGLILEGASRLDAFSVYPFPAWLPSYGPGGPAGAPEAGPPRSSRTKGSSPQTSCAHAG